MFTSRDVKRFVDAADLPDYADKNLLYPFLTVGERQKIICSTDDIEHREIAASIEIQRCWKGYRTRKILFAILCPESDDGSYLSSNRNSPILRDIRASLNSSPLCRVESALSRDLSKLQSSYHSYTENLHRNQLNKQKLLSFQGFAAWTIQSWWREIKTRLVTERKIILEDTASKRHGRHLSNYEAAIIIQKAWRRHIDIQVFQYYKHLINFRNKGNPHFMLRCINPKEADLLDASAGIHIRFRMGGIKFPPNIYYKIYTHINVADVGAFSPRNYVDPSAKHLPGKFIHNRGLDQSENNSSGWYERYENNGWRLVSERVMKYFNQDPIVYESSQKKMKFCHDKLVRRQDLALKKKLRKINWMKKMYSSGFLKTNEDKNEDVNDLVETVAQTIFAATEESGPEVVEDWQVDELLEWTKGLNFDSYLEDWQQCGTTSIQSDLKGHLRQKDPFSAMVEENC